MPKNRVVSIPAPVDLEALEPNIAQAMTIPVLVIPAEEEFQRYKEEDLADLGKRDRKTVLRMAELEQWVNWCVNQLLVANTHNRQLEAERLRLLLEIEKMKLLLIEQNWKFNLAKWIAAVTGTGFVGAIFKWLFDHHGK